MRARGLVIVLAVAAVIATVFASSGGDDEEGGGTSAGGATTQAQQAPADATQISFAYSPEKEPLLKPLVEQFNGEQQRLRRAAGDRRGRGAAPDRGGTAQADGLVAGLVAVGAAARVRGRPQPSSPRRTRRSYARRW